MESEFEVYFMWPARKFVANNEIASSVFADLGDGHGGRRQHPRGPLAGHGKSHQHTACAVKAGPDRKLWRPTDDLST